MRNLTLITAFLNSTAKRFLLLFCIGFIVRMGFNIANGWYTYTSSNEPQNIAHAIVTGKGFSNPFVLPTGPTAHLAPAFPGLLAGVYELFGEGIPGLFVADAANSVVSASVAALLPEAALLCGVNPAVGFFAGLFYAVIPPQPYTESKGEWEAAIGALLLISAFIIIRKQISLRDLKNRDAIAAGLLIGIAGLFLPTLCPVIVGFLAVLSWYKRQHIKQLISYGLIAALVTFGILCPWLIRNRIVFGQWVPIRDNFGLELRVSYWDKAAPTLTENLLLRNHAEVHPHVNKDEARKVRDLGEVEYNKRQLELAKEWISQHPRRFLELTLLHFQSFWTVAIRFVVLIPFAIWGAVRIWKLDKPSFFLFSTTVLLQPLFYYFVQFTPRYRHPVEWAVTLAAVIGVFAIFKADGPSATVFSINGASFAENQQLTNQTTP